MELQNVKIWEQEVVIPTYETGEPDKNPIFLEKAIASGDYETAVKLHEEAAKEYPDNLGEGKLTSAQENNIYYYLGLTYEGLKEAKKAKYCFEKAAIGLSEPAGMMYYNDQPPEMIFYQGAALLRSLGYLGKGMSKEAESYFEKAILLDKAHLGARIHAKLNL